MLTGRSSLAVSGGSICEVDGRVPLGVEGPLAGRQLVRLGGVEHQIILEHAEASTRPRRQHKPRLDQPQLLPVAAHQQKAQEQSK